MDTHALLSALSAPGKLAARASDAITDPSNRVFFSATSCWEIAIKAALGKIEADLATIARTARDADFEQLPVTVAHIRPRSLPLHHNDPFDRILIAQGLEEGLTVVTRDLAFQSYEVPTLFI